MSDPFRPDRRALLGGAAAAAGLALGGARPARAADIRVSDREGLFAALARAGRDDTILLEPGFYGRLELSKSSGFSTAFPPGVTLASADPANPAVFGRMYLRDVSNLTLAGLVFDYTFHPPDDTIFFSPFRVLDSDNIRILNSVFDGDVAHGLAKPAGNGQGYGFGLSLRNMRNVTVAGNRIYGFSRGLVSSGIRTFLVAGNELSGLSGDGMNFAQVRDTVIEGNHIHDFARGKATIHPDMIQFWTAETGAPSQNVVIRRNLLNSGQGPWTQSIFMRNELVDTGKAGDEMFYRNLTIAENLIINAHLHGITVGETDGLNIRNNTVVRNAASSGKENNYELWTPRINIKPKSRNVRVTGNVSYGVHGFRDQPGWRVENNLVVQDRTRVKPGFYWEVFRGTDPGDPASFAPRPGGPLDGTGIGAPVFSAPMAPAP